jgi:hypothetical protein
MPKKVVLAVAAVVAAIAAGGVYAAGGMNMGMGTSHALSIQGFRGYYDGHFVTYLSTDISSKTEAKSMHINYSAQIGTVKHLPEIYLVEGRAAVGQIAVFGSEPGEPSYSPLWDETLLTWKAGATPVVIKSDTQVNALEKKGVLSERPGNVVLNCPIIKIG